MLNPKALYHSKMSTYMNLKRCKNALFIVFLIFSSWSNAQLAVPFKERYKVNVKGDMTIIANSVLNRIDKKNSTNMPFNDKTFETLSNDEMDMEYIDIDTDKETFSSSSAALFLKNEESKKIIYAGLYWSATYKYESGYKKGEDKFVAFDKTREFFDEVLVKFPTQKEYKSIKGEIIFDGIKDKNLKEVAPYTVYADITPYVKELENPFGFYTVANIKATQGTLIGGSAAGWTIIFVYEDLSMTEKFISSYDGFAGGSSERVDINFKNFETQPEGDVIVKLACSALEGDFNVDGDLLMFSSSTNTSLSNIKTGTRKYSNFFDSSITIEDENFQYRIPDSKNTLGYDALITTLRNPNNSKIGNNAKDARVSFKSSGDVFYMFFCALNIEIKPSKIQIEQPEDNTKVVFEDKKFKLVDKTTNKEIIQEPSPQTIAENAFKPKVDETETSLNPEVKTVSKSKDKSAKPNTTSVPSTTDIVTNTNSKPKVKEVAKTSPEAKVVTSSGTINSEKSENLSAQSKQKPVDPKLGSTTDLKKEDLKSNSLENSVNNSVQRLNNIDMPKGYYLVANVFNERVNAAKFMMRLRDSGLDPNYFTSPENNFMYVYLDFVNTRAEADALRESKLKNTYFEELWILIVNITE